jgi:hypothetical protein
MVRRIVGLDVRGHLLLVDIDENMAFGGLPKPGAGDLPGLEDGVAVGEDDDLTEALQVRHHLQGLGVKQVGEGVVHHPGAHAQDAGIVEVLLPVELEGAQVVGVSDLRPAVGEDLPVAGPGRLSVLLLEVGDQGLLKGIVIEEGIVDVEQKNPFLVQGRLLLKMSGRSQVKVGKLESRRHGAGGQAILPGRPGPLPGSGRNDPHRGVGEIARIAEKQGEIRGLKWRSL